MQHSRWTVMVFLRREGLKRTSRNTIIWLSMTGDPLHGSPATLPENFHGEATRMLFRGQQNSADPFGILTRYLEYFLEIENWVYSARPGGKLHSLSYKFGSIIFHEIVLQGNWHTLFVVSWREIYLDNWCLHSCIQFCVLGWLSQLADPSVPSRYTRPPSTQGSAKEIFFQLFRSDFIAATSPTSLQCYHS